MASRINPGFPTRITTTVLSVRRNFEAAKEEIEALETHRLSGIQLTPAAPQEGQTLVRRGSQMVWEAP